MAKPFVSFKNPSLLIFASTCLFFGAMATRSVRGQAPNGASPSAPPPASGAQATPPPAEDKSAASPSPPPPAPPAAETSSPAARGSVDAVRNQIESDPDSKKRYESADDFSFNPIKVSRDPFVPLKSQKNASSEDDSLDEGQQCKKKLPLYDINQMDLVGILRGSKAHALIVLPSGLSCVVEVGTRLGRRNGHVTQIKSSEVVILEEFTDFKNRKRPDTTTLVLAQ